MGLRSKQWRFAPPDARQDTSSLEGPPLRIFLHRHWLGYEEGTSAKQIIDGMPFLPDPISGAAGARPLAGQKDQSGTKTAAKRLIFLKVRLSGDSAP
jgi:hypothetical protein